MIKNLLFFSFFLLSQTMSASTNHIDAERIRDVFLKHDKCGNFVQFDSENIYIGYGAYRRSLAHPRRPIPSQIEVLSIHSDDNLKSLSTLDSAIDSLTYKDRLYILTYSGLEVWDRQTWTRSFTIPTIEFGGDLLYKDHAQSMARYKSLLVIAHGRRGVSFIDLNNHQLVKNYPLIAHQAPMESMATGVVISGDKAYLSLDNFTLQDRRTGKVAFRGIAVIDLKTLQVEKELPGLDPGATELMKYEDRLIVSYNGQPIWNYSIEEINRQNRKLPRPRRVWKFPYKGHPKGKGTINDSYFYTCFLKAPETRGNKYQNKASVLSHEILSIQ